jgi:hypothetical protein
MWRECRRSERSDDQGVVDTTINQGRRSLQVAGFSLFVGPTSQGPD